mmetsp:Transcript_53537/g.122537  ORF Transcript_53537/g.122537 Transcript_53537/m.122537 type:complete len:288 (+) Transcript_53537:53-916(+)
MVLSEMGEWIFETKIEVVRIELGRRGWKNFRLTDKVAQEEQRKAQEQEAYEEERRHLTEKMKSIPPDHWGITGEQLLGLVNKVEDKFKGADPNVYTVVDDIIKPMCKRAHVSYAILLNPSGIKCTTFITHAWKESFLKFVSDIMRYFKDFRTRVFWICFTANPQTWLPDELGSMLGSPLQSPFVIAIRTCDTFVVVRNTEINMYTRLWCVAELVLVCCYTETAVEVIGEMPKGAKECGGDVGLNASCYKKDEALLRAVIRETRLDANTLVAEVIRARWGAVLRLGRR